VTAKGLIDTWDERDRRYASDERAAARAHEMQDGIRANRAAELRLLPVKEQKRALVALTNWRPPVVLGQ
jgi:hypothetical protein